MKRPALLLALLLLALSCSDGTLLARGRSRTNKNRDRTSGEASYVCLDAPIDLPPCTFSAEGADRGTRDKSPRERRGLSGTLAAELDGEDVSSTFDDDQAKSRAVIVVYKIEGCIPSRLPFDLPICKEEDSVGRIVEVRRLFPFNVMGLSGYNSGTTLVFPEVDVDQWHRFVHGPWTHPAKDIVDKVDGANGKNARTEVSTVDMPKTPKRKKVDSSIGATDKKKKSMLRKLKKFDRQRLSRKMDKTDNFAELPTVGKLQVIDDRRTVDPVSSYETPANRFHRMDDHRHQRPDRNTDPLSVEKASFARRAEEFPHANAMPYDPKKLRISRIYSEFPYREATVPEPTSARRDGSVEDEKFNGDPPRLDDLPYAQAITYYPEEADSIGVAGGFPYNRDRQEGGDAPYSEAFAQAPLSGRSNRMLVEGDHYGPPAKFLRIPQDRNKPEIAKADFPYNRDRQQGHNAPHSEAFAQEPLSDRSNRLLVEGDHDGSPYAKFLRIPQDQKKPEIAKADFPYNSDRQEGHNAPYFEAVAEEPLNDQSNQLLVEGDHYGPLYAKFLRIPQDRKKPEIAKADFSYNRDRQEGHNAPHSEAFAQEPLSDRSNRLLVEGDHYGSPYAKFLRIPQDRKKPEIGKADSPYTRAIAYDTEKLRIASRGSESPYAKAIPYDPKKLFEESTRGIIDIGSSSFYSRGLKESEDESKSSSSRVVPFDSRMLDAAKEGRIFPYGKAIPEDTSRVVEGMLSRAREMERVEAPVRYAKTFTSDRVPSYTRSRQIGKDERRLQDMLTSREVRGNIINTGKEDFLYELPIQGRVTRSAMEPDAPGDASFDDDNSEAPRRWSEFPYSKAIPFDPSKLRRPRSTVEDYVKASIVAPRNFPYAKAIPYDPWKFAGFRRKKSEARRERMIDDESKLLEGLELSQLGRFIF